MRGKEIKEISQYGDKAMMLFLDYRNYCQKIESILREQYNDDSILDVSYQPGDGMVVCVMGSNWCPDNIPLDDYIKDKENGNKSIAL